MATKQHKHEETVHAHEHRHVTHYLRPGEEWVHMTASHRHQHNHAELSHAHESHRQAGKEHEREAHIHDHAAPARSGRAR